MPSPKRPIYPPFSRLLTLEEEEQLGNPDTWRWVHSLGHECEESIHDPVHEKFLKTKDCVHAPAHREIMLTLQGDTKFGFEGKVYRRVSGTVFLFDHYESRDWKVPHTTQPYSSLWLHLRDRHFLTYNTVARDSKGTFSRTINTRFKTGELPQLIMDAWDDCRAHPQSFIRWSSLKAIVTCTLFDILHTVTLAASRDQHKMIVSSIQDYIKKHLADNLSLKTLAHIAGYSPYFFHRIFLKHAGMPLGKYIDKVRLEKAKELLMEDYKIEAVAELVGMSSPYSFSRFFKKHTTVSPGRWTEAVKWHPGDDDSISH